MRNGMYDIIDLKGKVINQYVLSNIKKKMDYQIRFKLKGCVFLCVYTTNTLHVRV